ncbi:MAG: hypothetical protein HY367_02690 [Candidatus Aenigmarchaeota archaeon]|nr:hypothetical protein [Candidatus Aenigmarchaeota archaeon]
MAAVVAGTSGLYRQPSGAVQEQAVEKYEDLFFTYELLRYPASTDIANATGNLAIGLNTDTDILGFGIIPSGDNYGTKHISLTNGMDSPARITVSSTGDIAPLMEFSHRKATLGPGESLVIDAKVLASRAPRPGRYEGEADIKIIRARHAMGALLLGLV